MLRPEDNVGGLRSDVSEEQSPRVGSEHPVHLVERRRTKASFNFLSAAIRTYLQQQSTVEQASS